MQGSHRDPNIDFQTNVLNYYTCCDKMRLKMFNAGDVNFKNTISF